MLQSGDQKDNGMHVDEPNVSLSLPSLAPMDIEDSKKNQSDNVSIQKNMHQGFIKKFEIPRRPNQTQTNFAVPAPQSVEIYKGNRFFPFNQIIRDNKDVQSQNVYNQYNGFAEGKKTV